MVTEHVRKIREQLQDPEQTDTGTLVGMSVLMVRRRLLFLTVFIVVLLASTAAVYYTKPVYETQAVLEVNYPDGASTPSVNFVRNLIPSAEEIVQRVSDKYDVSNRLGVNRASPYLESVRRFENSILLSVRSDSVQSAKEFLERVMSDLRKEVLAPISKALRLQQSLVLAEEAKVAEVRQLFGALYDSTLPATAGSDTNPVLFSLLSVERARALAQLSDFERKLVSAKMRVNLLESVTMSVVRDAEASRGGAPVSPRPRLYITVGLLLGLFFAACAVILAEFLSTVKNRL